MNAHSPAGGGRGPGCGLLIVLLVLGLVVVPLVLGAAGGGSPAGWLDERYERVSGDDPDEETVVWQADGDFDEVVNAIVAGTDPDDQTTGSATPSDLEAPDTGDTGDTTDTTDTTVGSPAVFLRYDSDWIVTVIRGEGDTHRVELDEFDRGYNRHGVFVGIWGGYYNRGGGLFRGGGSGFGK